MPEPSLNRFKDSPISKFCDTTDAQIQEILIRSAYGYKHMTPTQYWAHSVLKDSFYNEEDEMDQMSWNLLDDDEQAQTVVANHRGDGKSMRSKAKISRGICFRLMPFVVYIQSTLEDAATEMDNVKKILMENDFIREVFGCFKSSSYEDVRTSFGKRAWYACEPRHPNLPKEGQGKPFAFVLPRSTGAAIRGRGIYLDGVQIRPRHIFGDDIENDELVLNEENRVKLKKWWFGAVMPAVPQNVFPDPKTWRWNKGADADYTWQPPYRIFVNGTILHHDGLINTMLNSSDWKSVRNPLGKAIINPDKSITYISLRPKKISDAQLTAKAMAAKQNHTLDTFYRESLCEPVAKENVCWTTDLFQYITLEDDAFIQESSDWHRFIIVDPSKSASQQADFTGIIAAAINPKRNAIVIREARAEHLYSNQIPDRAIDIAVETNSQNIFVEIIGQRGVTDINFTNAISKRGIGAQLWFLDQGHTPRGDYGTGNDAVKRWRGSQILPYYQDKEVWHHPRLRQPESSSKYERFLLDFPLPVDWCLTDCAGYIPAVMSELGIVFMKTQRYSGIQNFKRPDNWSDMTKAIKNREWARV